MQIAIYGRHFGPHFYPIAQNILSRLTKVGFSLTIYEPFLDYLKSNISDLPKSISTFTSFNDIDKSSKFIFSMGGDGTILETIDIVRDSAIPVVGINSGRLGFLANISREEIEPAIDQLLEEKYIIENRSLIELTSPQNIFGNSNFALNEFALQKKDASMISIKVWLNNRFITSYWADGLIISTPTGSTAYSLSVGGPLLSPDTSAFVISPIAPHNLTVRPIVIPDSNIIKLSIEGRSSEVLVSMDYRSAKIPIETTLTLKRSEFDIQLVRFEDQDFFKTLRNKLMWGADKRN